MPVLLRVDAVAGLILTTFSGVVTNDDVDEYGRVIAGHPAIRPTFDELVDLSEVQAITATSDALRSATHARARVLQPPARQAVVAPADFAFGIARMLHMEHPEGAGVAVFRDRAAARAWLGLAG